jgi:hypothetical protein
MKLVLDREELFALLLQGLLTSGFQNVEDIKLDLGDATLSLDDVQGLVVILSK